MRRIVAAALCALCLLPLVAQAGDDSDPFVDLGLSEALAGSEYAGWRHMYNIYYQEGVRGVAILQDEGMRGLFLFGHERGAWHLEKIHREAVCQGAGSCMYVRGEDENPSGGSLILTHMPTGHTIEQYRFAWENGEWVFDDAYFRTPYDRDSDTVYTDPQRIAYVTWQDGELRYDWYTLDQYDSMPDAPRVESPGDGYWIREDTPSETIPWPGRITLDSFSIDAFPRDRYTDQWRSEPGYLCAWKLGERDPSLVYATVNNPNPKDRLNLRQKADTASTYLGKYYSGVEVWVVEEVAGGWSRVRIGSRMGYMRSEFLAFGDAGASVESAMPVYRAPEGRWNLLLEPFDESNVRARFYGGETLRVMGLVSGWWHVECDGQVGFIRALESLE